MYKRQDQYIAPLLAEVNPVFTGLIRVLLIMAGIYAVGVLSTLIYTRLMVRVSQGSLKAIRDDMFNHMQSLPIRYFDTHTHGDVMSHYTNDTDTLRQFISQALPQLFSCAVTIIASFSAVSYTHLDVYKRQAYTLQIYNRWTTASAGPRPKSCSTGT